MSPDDDKDNPILQRQDTLDSKCSLKTFEKDSKHYVLLEPQPSSKKCGFESFVRKVPFIATLVFVVVMVLGVCFHFQSTPHSKNVRIGSIFGGGPYTRKESVTLEGSHVKYNFVFLKGANGNCLPNTPEPCALPDEIYEEWNSTIPDKCPDGYEDGAAYQANDGTTYGACSGEELIPCSLKAANQKTTLALDDSLSCDRSHIFVKVRVCVKPGSVCLPYGEVKIKDDSLYTVTGMGPYFPPAMLRPSDEGEGLSSSKNYVGFDKNLDNAKLHNHWRFHDRGDNKFRMQNRGNGQWLTEEYRTYDGKSSHFGNFNMDAGVDVTVPLTCDENGLISNMDTNRGSFQCFYSKFVVFDPSISKNTYETKCGDECTIGRKIGGPYCCKSWACLYSYYKCELTETINHITLKFLVQEIRYEETSRDGEGELITVPIKDYSEWASHQLSLQLTEDFGGALDNVKDKLLSNTNWASEPPKLRSIIMKRFPLTAMKRAGASSGRKALKVVLEAAGALPLFGIAFGVAVAMWEAMDKAETDAALAKLAADVNKQIENLKKVIDGSYVEGIENALNANMDLLKNEGKLERKRVFSDYKNGIAKCAGHDGVNDLVGEDDFFKKHLSALLKLMEYNESGNLLSFQKLAIPILRLGALEYGALGVDLAALRGFFSEFRATDCGLNRRTCAEIIGDLNVQERAEELKAKANEWLQNVINQRKAQVFSNKRTHCPDGYYTCWDECCTSGFCTCTPKKCPCLKRYTYIAEDKALKVKLLEEDSPDDSSIHLTVAERYKSMLEWSMKTVGSLRLKNFNEAMDKVAATALEKCEKLYDLPGNEARRANYVSQEPSVRENMYQTLESEKEECPAGGWCGGGKVNSGKCSTTACCSSYGWCGWDTAWCNNPPTTCNYGYGPTRCVEMPNQAVPSSAVDLANGTALEWVMNETLTLESDN